MPKKKMTTREANAAITAAGKMLLDARLRRADVRVDNSDRYFAGPDLEEQADAIRGRRPIDHHDDTYVYGKKIGDRDTGKPEDPTRYVDPEEEVSYILTKAAELSDKKRADYAGADPD